MGRQLRCAEGTVANNVARYVVCPTDLRLSREGGNQPQGSNDRVNFGIGQQMPRQAFGGSNREVGSCC